MLIVKLFTVNGNLYSTSFCISAILECEFRRDSIRRCFCCWRLVRPPGEPAAEEEALLVRGKSQLILHGSPGSRPYTVLACFSQRLSPVVLQRQKTRRRSLGPQCWAAASSLSKPGWGSSGFGVCSDCG